MIFISLNFISSKLRSHVRGFSMGEICWCVLDELTCCRRAEHEIHWRWFSIHLVTLFTIHQILLNLILVSYCGIFSLNLSYLCECIFLPPAVLLPVNVSVVLDWRVRDSSPKKKKLKKKLSWFVHMAFFIL